MNFINVEWFLTAVTAVLHPFGILELISVHITDDGSTVRAEFHAETVRITVIDRISAAVINTIFILANTSTMSQTTLRLCGNIKVKKKSETKITNVKQRLKF